MLDNEVTGIPHSFVLGVRVENKEKILVLAAFCEKVIIVFVEIVMKN